MMKKQTTPLQRALVVRAAYCIGGKPVVVRTEQELADEVQKAMDASATAEVSIVPGAENHGI